MNPKTKLLAALFAAAPLLAQAQGQTGEQPPARDPTTITLSFDGGTLKDLLDRIRAQAPGVNIVASGLAADIFLSAVELRAAPIQAALESITMVVPEPYRAKAIVAPGNGVPVYSVIIAANRPPPPPSSEVRVFTLSTLTKALPTDPVDAPVVLPAKTVLSAIEAGAHVLNQQFDLRFHEESGLLFVRGSAEQIELVQQVLGNLQREQERVRRELRPPAPRAGEQGPREPK